MPGMTQRKAERGRYAQGEANFNQIVQAAEKVLIEHGHAALTLRRVADECGLRVGHISYYFPSKHQLIRALLESLIASYQGDLAEIEAANAEDAEAMLTSLMIYWMKGNETIKTSRTFVEIWSMGNSDPHVREEITKFYSRGRGRFSSIFAIINPKLNETELDALAVFTISMLEGIMVFANKDQEPWRHMPQLAATAIQTAIHNAKNPDAREITALAARWREPSYRGGPK